MTRVEGWGRVDRTRTLRFTFDGEAFTGHPGDTLASALLAHGRRVLGTSVKFGRPRGVAGSWTEDPAGLVQVEEPFPEPMLQASVLELTEGLVARGVNGRGRLSTDADPARYEHRHTHCDVLVVGAGPAGLVAARRAARAGESVVLVDDRAAAGGSLAGTEQIDGRPAGEFVAAVTGELARHPEVTHLQRTTAFGHYDDGFVLALERRVEGRTRQRVHRIRAGRVVIAAGAIERPIVVEDNDRPGVMLASAARDFLHRYGVRCGADVVAFTTDDSAYAAAADLAEAGAAVRILDGRDEPPAGWARHCAERGIAVRAGTVVRGTRGDDRVRGVVVDGPDGPEELACDLLLVGGGWNPTAHLFSHVGGPLAYDAALGSFRPARAVRGVEVVGAANGTLDLAAALREADPTDPPVALPDTPSPTRVLWRTDGDPARQFVDIARDATVADVGRAVAAGLRSVEHIKRYTTIGTAHDQGKTSGVVASGIAAELLERRIEDLGTTTFRPPYVPVAFAALAGRERGMLFDPVRTTALHGWHERAGAVFEDVGQWKRPRHYPRPGEDMTRAVLRECAAVRGGVGIMDGSTLGKIDVQGRDAGELLDRLYTNTMSSLKVGRVRYGLMCGNDGMVVDDGTVLRLAPDRFLVTTTTGNAAAVLDRMEEWLQTEWPDLAVHLTSVTDQWSVLAVVGPRSRDVVGEVVADLDVSAEAFGFMAWRETALDGVPVRIARISFSGELAYEVNVASRHALALWERLLDAGRRFDITPYGTETMHVLRAEKGFPIIGQDTDGTVSPHDLGMAWAVSAAKADFVGKRSFTRVHNRDPRRKQLVSLLPDDATTLLPEGSQIVDHRPDGVLGPPPVPMLGHVTSSYRSVALGRTFALALVAGGRDRIGETVDVPVGDALVPARIAASALVDPDGARRDGDGHGAGVHGASVHGAGVDEAGGATGGETGLTAVHPLRGWRSALAHLSSGPTELVVELEPAVAATDLRLAPVGAAPAAAAAVLGGPLPAAPGTWRTVGAGRTRAFRLGPDQWLVTEADDDPARAERLLGDALAPHGGGATDVTDQRTGLRVGGSRARELLSTGCSLDLRPHVLGPGDCAQTVLWGAPALLAVVDDDRGPAVRVLVRPSFADHLVARLLDAAEESRHDPARPA